MRVYGSYSQEACAICSLRLASAVANLGQGELGKAIKKDSDTSDLPACKGTHLLYVQFLI